MKKSFLFGFIILITCFSSCKKDDDVSCLTCRSEITLPFELCKENDGTASVNGENTGVPYDLYLSELEKDGVECGD